jgi:glycosyltransferase involved in cell wall biosynthesis
MAKVYEKPNVAIVAGPVDEVGCLLLESLISELVPICNHIYLITTPFAHDYAKNVHVIEVNTIEGWTKEKSFSFRFVRLFLTQAKFSLKLLQVSKKVDMVLFHLGEYINVIPVFCSKIIRKRSGIFHLGGNKIFQEKADETSGIGRKLVPVLTSVLVNSTYTLVDKVICQSERIVSFGNLEHFRKKIFVTGGRYLDLNLFHLTTNPSQKENLVGFIGKFWQVKGVLNFVKSFPIILSKQKNVKFILIGDGYLRARIENEIRLFNIENDVTLTGWVSHDSLPNYLGKMKILVLPSYTEGVPGVVLEAMASRVVVLATPVGGTPDLVKDGETGFILENNSMQNIAKQILLTLNDPELDNIALSAQIMIKNEYSPEAVVKRFQNMLMAIKKS